MKRDEIINLIQENTTVIPGRAKFRVYTFNEVVKLFEAYFENNKTDVDEPMVSDKEINEMYPVPVGGRQYGKTLLLGKRIGAMEMRDKLTKKIKL